MSALRSEADIKLNLPKRSANDPKRSFSFFLLCRRHQHTMLAVRCKHLGPLLWSYRDAVKAASQAVVRRFAYSNGFGGGVLSLDGGRIGNIKEG